MGYFYLPVFINFCSNSFGGGFAIFPYKRAAGDEGFGVFNFFKEVNILWHDAVAWLSIESSINHDKHFFFGFAVEEFLDVYAVIAFRIIKNLGDFNNPFNVSIGITTGQGD